mmetsp:Transcript_12715/g.28856  ORF Transcript_12715/g.28856 Transcript_12715/m.28856 type:complete len:288 (+) Transcript_12715:2094-2957(+)
MLHHWKVHRHVKGQRPRTALRRRLGMSAAVTSGSRSRGKRARRQAVNVVLARDHLHVSLGGVEEVVRERRRDRRHLLLDCVEFLLRVASQADTAELEVFQLGVYRALLCVAQPGPLSLVFTQRLDGFVQCLALADAQAQLNALRLHLIHGSAQLLVVADALEVFYGAPGDAKPVGEFLERRHDAIPRGCCGFLERLKFLLRLREERADARHDVLWLDALKRREVPSLARELARQRVCCDFCGRAHGPTVTTRRCCRYHSRSCGPRRKTPRRECTQHGTRDRRDARDA